MQILPLIQSRTASSTADAALMGSAGLGSRQSALFASILDSARTGSSSSTALSTTTNQSQTQDAADLTEAAAAPSDEDLKKLPMTREDIAALRPELKDQGFTDEELDALEERAGDGKSLTWGELMTEVEKKVATTEKSGKKTISNDDQVQLLGLFGKLGFTQDESQKMIDALSRGETQSVWSSVNGKLDALSGNESFSLNASELTTLGRAMNLSDDAQARLAALFTQSGAEAGLSGQGLVTAMGLVKNELAAQIGKENQALSDFRDAASSVLANAWQREATSRNSDLHQDDVARKAGQIVAMSNGQGNGASGLDALADVPLAGQGVAQDTDPTAGSAKTSASAGAATGEQTAQATHTAASQPTVTAELAGKAGAVAAEQAGLAGQPDEAALAQKTVQSDTAAGSTQKTTAVTQAAAGQTTANFSGGQQGASGENAFGQPGQDGSMAELMSKIRFGGKADAASLTTQTAEATPVLAAMDALKTSTANQSGKTLDPALAARVAKQVETGILKGVAQEAKQLTVNLTPDELGPVSVTLSVKDKEVRAVITADNADAAAALQEQAGKIKQTLEDQGFKVAKLDVQTGLAQDNQAGWDSPERHNEAREQREAQERIRSSVRLAREAAASDFDSSAIPGAMTARASGLDLFA
ncbi:flagellar hook-length control protein FliK [Desulfovibrio sp. TomC]|uniref:flagellar hook-length control protein FliK n=1 Tax=Desulfovibrio sp. TomC TaxID=1562888 RepID=UPI000575637E|nr:flagellar hook-length control protein FliK [Desulfovibrio sp. TomC]KHK02231.1 hypothetical protein NY78_2362 [Desulfovibrio sp. TomC]